MEREELLALLRGNEWDDVEAKESACSSVWQRSRALLP
jgi:hypothetical protein